MKNLRPLDPPFANYFDAIVDGKNDAVKGQPNNTKQSLELLKGAVAQHYGVYEQKFATDDLLSLPTSTYVAPQKGHLIEAYTGGGAALDGLKAFIKAAQPARLQGTCQYCGISIPKTIDHYVPKEDFPEFAVMPLNLVPCCSECNGYKSSYWHDSRKRAIINFYIDQISSTPFLFANLIWRNRLPIPTFYIENKHDINEDLFFTIERHFDRLRLLRRYKDQSNDFITDTIDSVVSNANNPDHKVIAENLARNASKIERRLGVNSWKTVLLQVLAFDENFIEQLSCEIASKLRGDEDDCEDECD